MPRRSTRKVAEDPQSGESDDEVPKDEAADEDTEDDTVVSKKAIIEFTPCTKKLFIVPDDLDGSDWSNVFAVKLPHPRTQAATYFLMDDSNVASDDSRAKPFVYEILNFDPPCRSWFIDDEVCSEGKLRIVTQLDPLFLIIPAMLKSSQAKPLGDHLCDVLPPRVVEIFSKKIRTDQLAHMAEKRVAGDIVAYVFSEDLTLEWLKKKVDKTVKLLTEKNLTAMEASISSNYVASSMSLANHQQFLEYACDIVGEYLEPSLKNKLCVKLGLPVDSERKRKSKAVGEIENGNLKKLKGEQETPVEPLENYGTDGANTNGAGSNTPKGAKAKALQKAAKGSQSLFKFFTPKN